jgi:hypothetical protein
MPPTAGPREDRLATGFTENPVMRRLSSRRPFGSSSWGVTVVLMLACSLPGSMEHYDKANSPGTRQNPHVVAGIAHRASIHETATFRPRSATARKRSIIALTCSGTSSWRKCPDPTVLPVTRLGHSSPKRERSVFGVPASM